MQPKHHLAVCLFFLAIAVLPSFVDAQGRETIPEKVARGVYGRVFNVPSGKSPTVDEVLATTDMIVRATVGAPRSYLSDDQTLVYTDYPLNNAVVLYATEAATARKPGPTRAVTITQRGGTVTIGESKYTQSEAALAPFVAAGSEYLFLLERRGDKYFPAHTYLGAFLVTEGKVVPLAKKRFAPEYRREPVSVVMQDLMNRLHKARR